MLSACRVQISICLALLVSCCVALSLVDAQAEKPSNGEKVRFTTVDGVDIQGMFYPGKKTAATVMMLHALEEDSRKKNWISLAESLNEAGYGVLTFDFRGHGQSSDFEGTVFWKQPRNLASIKGAPRKEKLEFKDMSTAYYPVFVNDIAAAKAFLDNRNDAGGGCNTSSLIVLGAETGATLGALWLNAEWHRYQFTPQTFMTPAKISNIPEGKNVIGAIWLSASSKLGSRVVSLPRLLDTSGRVNATPMVFMYGENDAASKTTALACAKTIKGAKKGDKKYPLTDAVPVQADKLKGSGLLQKTLPTEKNIVEYVGTVFEAKGKEWEEHDFRKNEYVWLQPGTKTPIPAKLPTEKTLLFDTYERFLPQ